VSSSLLAHALGLALLYPILPYLAWVALIAWTITGIGLVRTLWRGVAAAVADSRR